MGLGEHNQSRKRATLAQPTRRERVLLAELAQLEHESVLHRIDKPRGGWQPLAPQDWSKAYGGRHPQPDEQLGFEGLGAA